MVASATLAIIMFSIPILMMVIHEASQERRRAIIQTCVDDGGQWVTDTGRSRFSAECLYPNR